MADKVTFSPADIATILDALFRTTADSLAKGRYKAAARYGALANRIEAEAEERTSVRLAPAPAKPRRKHP